MKFNWNISVILFSRLLLPPQDYGAMNEINAKWFYSKLQIYTHNQGSYGRWPC